MTYFKDNDIKKLKHELALIKNRYHNLLIKTVERKNYLTDLKAKEYILYGVARRLSTIEHCIQNIFSIFPPDRQKILNEIERKNIVINLHAFFVNIFGVLDNMAWVIIHEKGINVKNNSNVGLFKQLVEDALDDNIEKEKTFKQYLNSDKTKNWHNTYLKNYRDALSHRIPLYVPPKGMTKKQIEQEKSLEQKKLEEILNLNFEGRNALQNEKNSIGFPLPIYIHSFSETENQAILLHAQVLTDFNTIEEILNKFCGIFTEQK